jgi:hypothetical protein
MFLLELALIVLIVVLLIRRVSGYLPPALSLRSYDPTEPVIVYPESSKKSGPVKATKKLLAKTSTAMPFGPVPSNVVTPSLIDKPVKPTDDLSPAAMAKLSPAAAQKKLGPPSLGNMNTPPDVKLMFENVPEGF